MRCSKQESGKSLMVRSYAMLKGLGLASIMLFAGAVLAAETLGSAVLAQERVGAGQEPAPPSLARVSDDARYRIGPGDVLSIMVRKAPELSVENVRVDQRGMIRIPMVDEEVLAACQTESDLATKIAVLYLEYKKSPGVAVYVREFQSRPVAVIGAINAPGQFRLQRRVRLLELLTFAGGPSGRAGRNIDIIHAGGLNICEANPDQGAVAKGDLPGSYKLDETLKGKEEANPFIQPGDIISIPEADQVFIIGHVMSPQALSLKDKQMTISRAMALVGGPARDANSGKIRIIRQTPGTDRKQELFVNLGAVMKQKAVDIVLLPDDIVEVPSSTGKTILSALTGAVAPTLANIPIRMIP
ncbi:MAG: polysaccharide biosynthesis/export family protein [Pyrinomonadaceae bacterium]